MRRKKKTSMTADDGVKITIGTNSQRDRLFIQLEEGGKAPGQARLTAPDAEALLWGMAEARAELREEVVPELEPVFRIRSVDEPAWRVSNPGPDGRRILALRHPGFGWVAFAMRQDRADAIARGLRGDGAGTKS